MASITDLKELRLRICDPSGVISITEVADKTAREGLTAWAKQTAYLQLDDRTYWIRDFDAAVWVQVEDLEISDARLENLIDLYGVARAAPRAVRMIMAALGKRMGIARSSSGAESLDYQTLKDTYEFYRTLAETMDGEAEKSEGTSSGRYLRMHPPCIGGGM